VGESLLLRASDCPGLLDGWAGPALSADGLTPVVLLPGLPGDGLGGRLPVGSCWAWWPMLGRAGAIPEDWVRLGLSRASTRDRVARWVAGRVGLECGATAPGWEGRSAWEVSGWCLDCRPGSRLFVPPNTVHRRPNWSQTSRRVAVPALAALSPDPARLPDGCRRVDAEALAVVARFVGGAP
jgi:hypothetical protein